MKKQFVTDWSEVPLVVDLPYVARLLGRSVESLKKSAQKGVLPGAFKVGRDWRVDRDRLRQHICGGL